MNPLQSKLICKIRHHNYIATHLINLLEISHSFVTIDQPISRCSISYITLTSMQKMPLILSFTLKPKPCSRKKKLIMKSFNESNGSVFLCQPYAFKNCGFGPKNNALRCCLLWKKGM
jgi:hypothetical protein